MDDYLSKTELDKLKLFVEDDVLVEAVRKVLLKGVYQDGILTAGQPGRPKMNFALALANNNIGIGNEHLGAKLRASFEGVSMVETGFDELLKLKKQPESQEDEVDPR